LSSIRARWTTLHLKASFIRVAS